MREFAYGALGMTVVCAIVLYAVDRYLRRPPKRYLYT